MKVNKSILCFPLSVRLLLQLLVLCITHVKSIDLLDYRFQVMPETSYYGGIHSIVKDSVGRMWFSGYDALFMYDGNSFVQMNDHVTTILPDLYWSYGQVVIDTSKQLYISTNQGLLRYNYQFPSFELILDGNIGTLIADAANNLWFIRDNSIQSIDTRHHTITAMQYPFPGDLDVPTLTLMCSNQDNIFVSSNGLIYRLEKESGEYALFASLDRGTIIRDVIEHDGLIYLLTHIDGLFVCDNKGEVLKHYDLSQECGKSGSTKELFLDSSGIIWIATQSGLLLLDPMTFEVQLLKHDLRNQYSIPNNSVWSIYKDPDEGVWIGTYGGKLAYTTLYNNRVDYFKASPGGLNHPIVSCFEEDEDGNLWIGTEGGGLNHWDKQTGVMSYFTHNNNTGVKSNMIKKLKYDKVRGRLTVSTFNGGIFYFDKINKHFVDLGIFHPKTSQPLSIYDFVFESDSKVWMTDPDSDLMSADLVTSKVTIEIVYDSQDNPVHGLKIEAIFKTQDSHLWLVTQKGAYKIDSKTRKIMQHYYIENAPYAKNNLLSYCLTSDSEIWFGTRGGGVNRLKSDGSYINYDSEDGLNGTTVFGILEDHDSKSIWFSTNKGLYFFDKKNNKIVKSQIDNLKLCGAFYVRSCYKTARGEMMFGGTDGFIMFSPDKIRKNKQKPKVFFTDLLINNSQITSKTENTPLKKDISTYSYHSSNKDKIVLSHKQSNIEICVSANSYLLAEKNQYAYRTLGVSNKWILLPPGQKTIQYYNMPSGKYTVEVKVANNDGIWGDEVSTLFFDIKPSFFLSTWAFLIYTIICLFIVYFVWRYFTDKRIYKDQIEIEKLKEKNMRKLTQARINFFTHISHDLKTPLTLVLDPLKQLKEYLVEDKTLNSYVQLIEKNVIQIQRMITQLLQFREIESQKITPNHQSGELISYVKEIFSLFDLYANKKQIETDMFTDIEEFYAFFDHDAVEKILTNLFSNAIKYTPEHGYVGVKISSTTPAALQNLSLSQEADSKYISISIANTGVDIPDSKKEQIFDSFYYSDPNKIHFTKSSGLGLAIVRELTASLGGNITLYSEDLKVVFTLTLPFKISNEKTKNKKISYEQTISEIDDILAESTQTDLSVVHSRKTFSIVVIEDNSDLRAYMEQRLSVFYNVHTAKDGEEGITKVERVLPQIVITDLAMPIKDGFEVCRSLRENIRTSHIPIVALSALGKKIDDKIRAIEAGANVFVDKPFDMDFLLKQIENLIHTQHELKELYSKRYIAEPSKVAISSVDEKILEKAMKYIEKHMDNSEYTVESFVSDMAIGRTLLYQKINDITGMSIKEFIMDIRLKRSTQLLKDSDLTISEIAYKTGFVNPKYFSVCFKRHFNLTPSEFKKQFM